MISAWKRTFLIGCCWLATGLVGGLHAQERMNAEEVLAEVESIVEERASCFLSHGDLTNRLRLCRKTYMRNILITAKKGYGKPQLGRFLLCLRECPMELALCKGDLELELRHTSCDDVERLCVKQCLIKFYW